MCWSGEASGVLATLGLGTAFYLAKKGESRELWLPLTYFALMEVLQAFTYIYINQCNLPENKLLTLLGYIHIMFQPFFVNMAAMYFIPVYIKQRIASYVYGFCSIAVIFFAFKLYHFPWTSLCHVGREPFCGPFACSLRGNWHIAWQLPLNDLLSSPLIGHRINGLHSYTYMLVGFIMPILYGSWRLILVTFMLGPFISALLTNNINEFPAVWCLFSIALCLTIIKSPLRKHLYAKSWFLYPEMFPGREIKNET